MKKFFTFLALCVALSAGAAYAGDLTVGGAWGYRQSQYKGVDGVNDMWGYKGPIPFAMYDSKYFFIGLPVVGVHVLNGPLGSVDVSLGLLATRLDPDQSDDWAVSRVDEREFTFAAGVSGKLNTPWGSLKGGIRTDILGRSDSVEVALGYSYPFLFMNQRLIVVPAMDVVWRNGAHNDYYYGVTPAESARTGLSTHNGSSSITPSIELSVTYMINQKMGVTVAGSYTILPAEVKDSPLVDKSSLWGGVVSFMYKFGETSVEDKPRPDVQNREVDDRSSMEKLRAQRQN